MEFFFITTLIMMITKLGLPILQMMLVAGTGTSGRYVRGSLTEVLGSDFRVVLIALQRSNPQQVRFPPGTLDTVHTVVSFLSDKRNEDMINEMLGEVDTLDLTSMNLERLPIHGIQQLSNLKSLMLGDNGGLSISKSDIESISHLSIEELLIYNSNISPETLVALQGLPNLTKLDISGNELLSTHTGDDRFGDLATKLVELRAANCDFDSSWLDSILKCVNLKFLNISKNIRLFKGKTPTTDCSFMKGLTDLSVSECYPSSEWLGDIFKCTNLKSLDVSENVRLFKGKTPTADCSFMKNLVSLNASRCDLGSEWLDDILKCTNLKSLYVSKNIRLFKRKVPTTDCSFMESLTSLGVAGCRLKSEWVDDILKCTNLVDLDMSKNRNIGMEYTNFSKFENLKSLKRLNVSACNLKTKNLNGICRCGVLEELNIGWNRRVWAGVVDFGTCRESIRVLKVDTTGLKENGLRALCGLPNTASHGSSIRRTTENDGFPNLAILDIAWNHTLRRVMSQRNFSFGRLENTLTELNVSGIGITKSNVFRAIKRCRNLVELAASWNPKIWLGADATFDFGRLKSQLRVLDVGLTNLPLVILSKIFELNQLVDLKIHHNDVCCQGLGSNNWVLGDIKDTLKRIDMKGTGLTGDGLQWIFRELKGLENVNARLNNLITADDLTRLDLSMLGGRLAKFTITADAMILADLRKRLPRTIVVPW